MPVFVLSKNKKPLMPCAERRARILLSRKRAVVVRMEPFTIRLKDRKEGDRVLAEVPKGRKQGTYLGRIAIRATGNFNIQTSQGLIQGISHRHCRMISRSDGYHYTWIGKRTKGDREQEHASRAALSILGINAEVSRAVG